MLTLHEKGWGDIITRSRRGSSQSTWTSERWVLLPTLVFYLLLNEDRGRKQVVWKRHLASIHILFS